MQVVEKFGGTSMAHPDIVLGRIGEQEDPSALIVVSAAGKDQGGCYATGLTNQLIALRERPSAELEEAIIERQGVMASEHLGTEVGRDFETMARNDIRDFRNRGWPLEALGELWSARLLARMGGFALLDPREVIGFDHAGRLDVAHSVAQIRRRVQPGVQTVMGGFVGSNPDGSVGVLPRGGSDTSGAVAALALAPDGQYRNWSDVTGFRTSDPRHVSGTLALGGITYREAREFGVRGSGLLHPQVPALLGHSAVTTVMCHTWSGNHGTVISHSRDWQDSPIIGVSAEPRLLALTLSTYGMNEIPGQTTPLFDELAAGNVPYKDSATGIDTVMITVCDTHRDKLGGLEDQSGLSGLTTHQLASVHVIGEGLSDPRIRMQALAQFSTAFCQSDVGSRGATDAGESPGMTFFVSREDLGQARWVAHAVVRHTLDLAA